MAKSAKKLRNRAVRTAVLCAALMAGAPSHAGGGMSGGATEVTQILNNAQLVLQYITQLQEYATQLEQYGTQMSQLDIQMRDIASGSLDGLNAQQRQALEAAQAAMRVRRAGQDLYRGVERLEQVGKQAQWDWAASDLTWEQWLQRRIEGSERQFGRRSVLSAEEQRVMNDVVEKSAVLQRYAEEIPHTQGSHESLQVLNGQMNLLVSHIQDMQHFNAQVSATQTEERLKETEEAARREQAQIEYSQRHGRNLAVDAELMRRLQQMK